MNESFFVCPECGNTCKEDGLAGMCGDCRYRCASDSELDSLCDLPTVRHTALPWVIKQPGQHGSKLRVCKVISDSVVAGICEILTARKSEDGFSDAEEQANADFICRAVNSHYDMLAALTRLVELSRDENVTALDEGNAWEAARAAISKAKGGAK